MKAASLHQIKKELETYSPQKMLDITLKLIKHKTENKEFVSYLLFDENDLAGYIFDLREDITGMLTDIRYLPGYQIKKILRKALKFITRYSRYTHAKETDAELLLHFCSLMKENGLLRNTNKAITVIFYKQLEKVEKMLPVLHEELQFDYHQKIEALRK